jgi:hypothetical protein
MPLKTIYAPHLGHTVKMGRKRPIKGPRLHLKNYLVQAVPPPPTLVDYSKQALSALGLVYLNDQLGDCVIAGGYHVVGVETGNADGGKPFIATDAQITADYSAIGDYVPGDPSTDNGCDEQTALNYWTQTGFCNGTKLVGWLAVDATNQTEVMQACYLFENLYFGLELPDAWVNPFPSASGFLWDDGTPDPNNGHCVMGVGYNSSGVQIDSWGLIGTLTWKAVAHLASQAGGGELYVMLTPDQLAKGAAKAPNGMAWQDLLSDFQAMGGNVPNPKPAPSPSPQPPPSPSPAPAPSPSPAPTPSSSVTLDQAATWAVQGLIANWPCANCGKPVGGG